MARKADPARIGRKTISTDGYVLIFVGKSHHLADVRGYAYEHRLVMEKKLRRRLKPGELVHHKDEDHANNASRNLEVETRASHLRHHDPRRFRTYKRSTTCLKGHEKNYRRPNGRLECRTCAREHDRKRRRGKTDGHQE